MDRLAWRATVHGVSKSRTRMTYGTTTNFQVTLTLPPGKHMLVVAQSETSLRIFLECLSFALSYYDEISP